MKNDIVKRKPIRPPQPIKYELGNRTFIVMPVYRNYSGSPIHQILVSLIEKDIKNLEGK